MQPQAVTSLYAVPEVAHLDASGPAARRIGHEGLTTLQHPARSVREDVDELGEQRDRRRRGRHPQAGRHVAGQVERLLELVAIERQDVVPS